MRKLRNAFWWGVLRGGGVERGLHRTRAQALIRRGLVLRKQGQRAQLGVGGAAEGFKTSRLGFEFDLV